MWGLLRVPLWLSLGLFLLIIAVGVPICGIAAKALGKADPGAVVWDEITAFPIVFLSMLVGWAPFNITTAVLGFVLFRVFDITKPWPARRLEHLPGGWGVMADDLAAGIYAGVALAAIEFLRNSSA